MSLKSSYMVWNRIISTGKLFDAMYPFVRKKRSEATHSWWVQFFLAESQSRLYPHMRAKFGCDLTAVSKKCLLTL